MISPEELDAQNPDVMLVLPWNLINELREQLRIARDGNPKTSALDQRIEMNDEIVRQIPYTPDHDLEVQYATDAAANGWGNTIMIHHAL